MNCIIALLAGVCLGIPLGWALLFCLVTKDIWPKEPKSKDEFNINIIDYENQRFNRKLVVLPAYIAKGLEFDAVIISNKKDFKEEDKYLFYVACTRCQHQLIIYQNQ